MGQEDYIADVLAVTGHKIVLNAHIRVDIGRLSENKGKASHSYQQYYIDSK